MSWHCGSVLPRKLRAEGRGGEQSWTPELGGAQPRVHGTQQLHQSSGFPLTAVYLVANDNQEGDAGAEAVEGDAGLGHHTHPPPQDRAHHTLICGGPAPLRHPRQHQQTKHDKAEEGLRGRGCALIRPLMSCCARLTSWMMRPHSQPPAEKKAKGKARRPAPSEALMTMKTAPTTEVEPGGSFARRVDEAMLCRSWGEGGMEGGMEGEMGHGLSRNLLSRPDT